MCDHNNSVRCESPPVDDTVSNWSGPWTRDQWVCKKCKQKSDVHPPLFRQCKLCHYIICHGCYYGVENTRDAPFAAGAAAGTNTLKRKMSESGEEVGGGSVLPRHGSTLAMKRAAGGVGGASAADKAAADKAAADKAAAIVIDLSRASDTYVHHLGVRFDYL